MNPVRSTTLVALLLLAATGCGDSSGGDRPNLLLVTLDTLRADRVGCYGYEAANTPALDALAARGVVFDEAYTPAPMTLPAHATLLTGLLPPEHGAQVNGVHRLAEDVPTLGERLSAEGYRTSAFVAAFVLSRKFGLDRGFDHYDDDLEAAYEQDVAESLSSYRPGSVVVDSALEWLASNEDGAGEQPFFAWVHLYDAHFPWHPHEEGSDPDSETGTYDGEVAFVDTQLGRLTAWLRERGLEENTIVVAVADHGEGLGDHHEIEHAYLLNEEVLHVPFVVAGPGVAEGHRVQALVSMESFQPTALDLLGLATDAERARSLSPALRGEPIESGESYAETDLPWTSFRWAPQRSLTTAEWKYIRTPQHELYDRERDRAEYANLAETKKDVLGKMERRLQAIESGFDVRESDVAEVSSEELEHLAALGYVAGIGSDAPDTLEDLADMKQRLAVKDLSTELRRRLNKESVRPQEHLEIALRLVDASPETPSFHNQVGSAYVSLNDHESALPYLEHVVEMVPTDAGAHYSLGDALQLMGRTPEARRHLEMALELEPKMASAHVGMGNVLRAEGRTDLAAGEYSEALRLRPEYPEAFYNLAMTFMDRNLLLQAMENFRSALEHKPGWGLAHVKVANLLMGAGRVEDAAPHFEAALAEFPGDPDLRNDYGVVLQRLGRPAEARDQFLAAVELAPGYFRPVVNLGNLAFDYGKDELALERYEEALRLAPGQVETTARLARFLATTSTESWRDGPRAVALAERAADMTGGEVAPILDTLAAAYASVGRFPDAVSMAHRAQQRAHSTGDQGLAAAIDERIGLYALGESYRAPRIGGDRASMGDAPDAEGPVDGPVDAAPAEPTDG